MIYRCIRGRSSVRPDRERPALRAGVNGWALSRRMQSFCTRLRRKFGNAAVSFLRPQIFHFMKISTSYGSNWSATTPSLRPDVGTAHDVIPRKRRNNTITKKSRAIPVRYKFCICPNGPGSKANYSPVCPGYIKKFYFFTNITVINVLTKKIIIPARRRRRVSFEFKECPRSANNLIRAIV